MHDGALRMKLRIGGHELAALARDHAAKIQPMMQRDDASKKRFEIATAARGAWGQGLGRNAKLRELALAMDSAA